MVKLEPVWDFNQNDSQTGSKTLNNLALKNGYEKDEKNARTNPEEPGV